MEPLLPPELAPYRGLVQNYVNARIRQFAVAFTRRLNLALQPAQLDACIQDTLSSLSANELNNARALRLVLRHDCQSTGCGESGCLLCQYNPSRLCKRNIKSKYLIDDALKAKCGAPLRVELVDENNACVLEGLPPGMQLECLVMNGEKYKEICPDNTLLTHSQLRTCIISHHTRALLRREGGSDDQLRCFLQLERGQSVLSDLQVTTSSEALLAGKAPTFRLLIWAVDANGEPVPNVTYVVSEYFVVATKRVKHAIKSDIPSVSDHVSKLVHIGKATVDKLLDLRSAAHDEGFEIQIPDELNRVDKVGLFQQLVELTEINTDLKNKVRHLLKLSPEKWDEVANHAQSAVVPDFRQRAWWCPALKVGLLFSCKNGAVVMDQPIALIKMGNKNEEDQVIPVAQLDVQLFNTIPKLKAQAVQSWYAQSHPGWAIYYKEGQQQQHQQMQQQIQEPGSPLQGRDTSQPGSATAVSMGGAFAGPSGPSGRLSNNGNQGIVYNLPQLNNNRMTTPPPSTLPAATPLSTSHHTSPAHRSSMQMQEAKPQGNNTPFGAVYSMQGQQQQQQQAGQLQERMQLQVPAPQSNALQTVGLVGVPAHGPGSNTGGGSMGGAAGMAANSPFAVPGLMGGLQDHFPQFPQQGGTPAAGSAAAESLSVSLLLNQLGNSLVPNSLQPGGLANMDPTKQEDNSLDRATMPQFNSLLGGDVGFSVWNTSTAPVPILGGSGSLNGSLNQTINALIQDQMDRSNSLEPPAKLQRIMPPEEAALN